jgi:hypothetical protein
LSTSPPGGECHTLRNAVAAGWQVFESVVCLLSITFEAEHAQSQHFLRIVALKPIATPDTMLSGIDFGSGDWGQWSIE